MGGTLTHTLARVALSQGARGGGEIPAFAGMTKQRASQGTVIDWSCEELPSRGGDQEEMTG